MGRACEIDEKNRFILLSGASIINGSQTQGVIRDFLKNGGPKSNDVGIFVPHVKFEVIVTDNEDLIAEVSIARNFQIDVMTLSIAGRRGQLEPPTLEGHHRQRTGIR